MALLCLLALSLLVQPATQQSREWNSEQRAFEQRATDYFARKLAPISIRHISFSGFDKCRHDGALNPYGLTKARLHVTCPLGDASRCGLYDTRSDNSQVKVVDCQFAGELTRYDHGRTLAAFCYQNHTKSSSISRESRLKEGLSRETQEIPAGVLCKKWRYPGTELPRLQVPEHLKSPHSRVLLYKPASFEPSSGYGSRSHEVSSENRIKNLYERTGFAGRGILQNYGPNAAINLLITRYSYGTTKVLIEDSDDYTALPRFWVKKGTVDRDLIKKKLQKLNYRCKASEINDMIITMQQYHRGYLKDKQNTDNAWLDGFIIHLHDNSAEGCFTPYPVHADVRSRQYRWIVLPHTTTPRDFALSLVANYK